MNRSWDILSFGKAYCNYIGRIKITVLSLCRCHRIFFSETHFRYIYDKTGFHIPWTYGAAKGNSIFRWGGRCERMPFFTTHPSGNIGFYLFAFFPFVTNQNSLVGYVFSFVFMDYDSNVGNSIDSCCNICHFLCQRPFLFNVYFWTFNCNYRNKITKAYILYNNIKSCFVSACKCIIFIKKSTFVT